MKAEVEMGVGWAGAGRSSGKGVSSVKRSVVGEGRRKTLPVIHTETDRGQVSRKESGHQIIKGHLALMKTFICLFNDDERAL